MLEALRERGVEEMDEMDLDLLCVCFHAMALARQGEKDEHS